MHVFVSGATGFVGLHTVLALRDAGHSVRLGVRNEGKMREVYRSHGFENFEFSVGEITDKDSVDRALQDCDAVVHTAALVSMDPGQAELMHRTNVEGTRTVIDSALQQGIESIIYVSSAAALFNPALSCIDESTPLATAHSPYSASKVEAERYVQAQIDRGANIAITYPTGVVGPDDPGVSEGNESLRFILRFCHVNTSSGLQIIDVRDLALAHRMLLEGGHAGRYVVAGHYCPWRDLGQLLEDVTGHSLLQLPVPGPLLRLLGKAGDLVGKLHPLELPITSEAMNFATAWVVCDDSKLRKNVGINYRSLSATVADTVQWLARAGHVNSKWACNLERR